MNTLKLASKFLLSCLLVAFMVSCSDDDTTTEEQQDYTEIAKSSEIDGDLEDFDDLSLKVFETQEANEAGKMPPNFNLPDCLTITVEMEQNNRTVTMDFGDGCQIGNRLYSGIVVMTYTRNPQEQERLITKTFDNFFVNGKQIEGSKTILKEHSNENGNMQFTKTVAITITWPNGDSAARNGVKVKEWIAGQGTGVWTDNVFEITGNWTTTFVNGNTHTYTVLTPLRRETICYRFVSGTIDVVRTNFSGVLDYGDGSCDNMATFTFADGTVVDIVLD